MTNDFDQIARGMTDQEINEAVARGLGWKEDKPNGWIKPKPHKDGFVIGQSVLPDYCHDIKAAWEVALSVPSEMFSLSQRDSGKWMCEIVKGKFVSGIADTAPMAICLAYLKLGDK